MAKNKSKKRQDNNKQNKISNNTEAIKISPEEKKYNKNEKTIANFNFRFKKFNWIFYTGFAFAIIAVLLIFLPFAEVYNSDISGAEVSVSGYNFFLAFFTRNFSSFSTGWYGDMAVPFYCYAKGKTVALSTLSFFAIGSALATLILSTLICWKIKVKKGLFLTITGGLAGFSGLICFISFITGLAMSSDEILSTYCNNNPACSIKSFAILPALFLITIAVGYIYLGIKNLAIDKLRKENTILKAKIKNQKQISKEQL